MTPGDIGFLNSLAPAAESPHGTGALPLVPDTRDFSMRLLPGVSELIEAQRIEPCDFSSDVQQIGNQGAEPSCVSFSTCGLASTEDFRGDRVWDPLDGHLFYRQCGGDGRTGIDSRAALERARASGIPLSSGGGQIRIGSYVFASQQPGAFRQEVAAAVSLGHFCTVALLLPSNWGWDSSGAMTSGYHQVVICGFTGLGDNDQVILLNSWGQGWGKNGFGRVTWAYLEQSRMQNGYCYSFAVTPLVLPKPEPAPPVPGPPPLPPPANNPPTELEPEAYLATACAAETNRIRQQNGLAPLRISPNLTQSAQGWSEHMAATNDYTHGANPGARMTAAGFSGNGTWGENIAAWYPDVPGVMKAWMDSPAHRSNILNPAYTDFGCGYAYQQGSQYGHYWTQDFAVSSAGPGPGPGPGPADVVINSVTGTKTVAGNPACAPGEAFRVIGRGFMGGVVAATIGTAPQTSSVVSDGLLIVTAGQGPVTAALYVRKEAQIAIGPYVTITGDSGPGPGPGPGPSPSGELTVETQVQTLSAARKLVAVLVKFQGVPAMAMVTASRGGTLIGQHRTNALGRTTFVVAGTGTVTFDARDAAGHAGQAEVSL